MDYQTELHSVIGHFDLDGELDGLEPYGTGHINDTFAGRYRGPNGTRRYIHQRLNHNVFKSPLKVMDNITRVTDYTHQQVLASGGDPRRQSLTLVPTRAGSLYHLSEQGNYWRTYLFIEGARSYDMAEGPQQLRAAARAFGNFQRLLSTLPGQRLHETIPNFHNTPLRFQQFLEALEKNCYDRAETALPEIEFILARRADTAVVTSLLETGAIPERVTHNDTKLNNVLIDDLSGEGLCIIDLDTVMPGSALYDFGDMVRSGAATAAEDEPDTSKAGIHMALFEELARGYLDTAGDFLNQIEIDHLAFSARLITLEQAIRFLSDYLNGDTYYKTHRPGQNLDRARTQIKMVREMEARRHEMEAIVRESKPAART